jgi:O-antigen biosynthesis protein
LAHIRFGGITRGEGKVFQLVYVDAPDRCRVCASAKSLEDDVPCAITSHDLPNGVYVVILAALSCSQKVEVLVFDSVDVCIASASETVSHFRAALSSKANTFLKNEKVNAVRNIDRCPLSDTARISSAFAVLDKKRGIRTTYFTIESPSETDELLAFRFGLTAENGEVVPVENLTVSHDTLSVAEEGVWPYVRRIELSCDVSDAVGEYTAWTRFGTAAQPSGLMRFTPVMVGELRGETDAMMFGRSSEGPGYQDWFLSRHRTTADTLELQKSEPFGNEPLFSVVLPLYGESVENLGETVDSVLAQTYSKFELLLALPAAASAQLKRAADSAAEQDVRIKVLEPIEDTGYSALANAGVRAAEGGFVCFFERGDILEPDLLFEYAKGVNNYPETDLLYCDEDKLVGGGYVDGLLKPDFDSALLLSCNFVRNMLAVSATAIAALDVLPEGASAGAYRLELTLRVTEAARNVYHARKVLYHWRPNAALGSSYFFADVEERVAGRASVQGHLDGLGIDANVDNCGEQVACYDITYALPEQPPLVSIIIPSKDHIDYLERCLESIYKKTTYPNFEVVVVENNSEFDSTFAFYDEAKQRYASLSVAIYEHPFNFSAVCNLGANAAEGSIYLFLNNDTEVLSPCWLEQMVGHLLRENIGCVGAKLLYPNGAVQHLGVAIPKSGPVHMDWLCPADSDAYFGLIHFPRSVLAVTGACLGVRSGVFRAVGGFDEGFPLAYNDVDFCLKVRKEGYINVVEPRAMLRHYESVSRGYDKQTPEQLVRLLSEQDVLKFRYPSFFSAGDPYYNCNFHESASHRELG